MVSPPYASLTREQIITLKATSNFADYDICKPYICCAWMDMHNDKDDYSYKEPYYKIKIIKSHPNAVLVYTDNGRYHIAELTIGDIIEFNQTKMHGILPRKLAQRIVDANRINVSGYKKWKKRIYHNAFKAKCVWKWIEDY